MKSNYLLEEFSENDMYLQQRKTVPNRSKKRDNISEYRQCTKTPYKKPKQKISSKNFQDYEDD